MRTLRRALLVGITCLTALSTLLAGTPHYACLCRSNKNIGTTSTSIAATPAPSACCCGTGCCSMPSEPETSRCCSRESDAANPHGQCDAGNCKTAWSQSDWVGSTPTAPEKTQSQT